MSIQIPNCWSQEFNSREEHSFIFLVLKRIFNNNNFPILGLSLPTKFWTIIIALFLNQIFHSRRYAASSSNVIKFGGLGCRDNLRFITSPNYLIEPFSTLLNLFFEILMDLTKNSKIKTRVGPLLYNLIWNSHLKF